MSPPARAGLVICGVAAQVGLTTLLNQMKDIAQEKIHGKLPIYEKSLKDIHEIKGAPALVFSITDRESYNSLIATCRDRRPVYIIGNKIDKASERVVSKEEAQAFASYISAKYVEVSALDPISTKQLLQELNAHIAAKQAPLIKAYIESVEFETPMPLEHTAPPASSAKVYTTPRRPANIPSLPAATTMPPTPASTKVYSTPSGS